MTVTRVRARVHLVVHGCEGALLSGEHPCLGGEQLPVALGEGHEARVGLAVEELELTYDARRDARVHLLRVRNRA